MTDDDRIIRPALSIGLLFAAMGLFERAAAIATTKETYDRECAAKYWSYAERIKAAMREAQR